MQPVSVTAGVEGTSQQVTSGVQGISEQLRTFGERIFPSQEQETFASVQASDTWFAANSLTAENAQGRELVQTAQLSTGIVNIAMGVINQVRYGVPDLLGFGVNSLFNSIRTRKEVNMVTASTAKEAHKEAAKLKTLGLLSIVPVTALAMATSTPILFGLAGGVLVSYLRYASAKSTQQQIEVVSSPERASVAASEGWFTKNRKRELPAAMRRLEQFFDYAQTGLFGMLAIGNIFTNPLLGVIMGGAAYYSWWKARKVMPQLIDYYKKMADDTKTTLEQVNGQNTN